MPGRDLGPEGNSIRAKRRAVSVGSLRTKYQHAPGDYGGGRALIRVGKGCTDILIGLEDLSTWDAEELRRGRKRDKDGGWRGKDPIVVPKAVHDELVKRTLDKANELMQQNLETAVQVLVEMVTADKVEGKDRLKAIEMIMNRTMGKEPQRIELDTGDEPWQVAIAHSIVSLPGELVDQHADNRETGDEDDDGANPFDG